MNKGNLQVKADDYSQSAEWSGPGTYAACAYYLLCISERDLANRVLESAISLQQADGSFVGKKTKTGDNIIHPVWHTAQMLRVILKSKFHQNANLVERIEHWIEDVQGKDGEYADFGQFVIYYTSYAALAFLSLQKRPQPYTDRTIDFLLTKSKNGKYSDFGGTIMAAEVFDAYLNENDLSTIYNTIQITQAKKLLIECKQLKAQIEELSKKLEEYDEKYKDADIILSKKDVWKIGVWFGVVTFVLGIIVPVIINVTVMMLTNANDISEHQDTYNQSYYSGEAG